MDPLSVLRDFTIRGDLDKIVRTNNDEIRFGNDYAFPCGIQTAYRSKQGNLYTLETLFHFIQNANSMKHTDYMQNARSIGIPAVTFIDRKSLLDYLTGRLSSSDSVVFPLPQHPPAPPPPPPPHHQNPNVTNNNNFAHPLDYDLTNSAPDVEEPKKVEEEEGIVNYVEMIYAVERPLKDRESLLEVRNRDFYSVLVGSTKREEDKHRMEIQQRKDNHAAKMRAKVAEDGHRVEELGFDSGMKPKLNLKGGKIGEGVPIILVPSASQTLITIYNVKEFLEDGIFVPTDVKAKSMNGPKPECVTVQKKFSNDRNRVMTAYEVRDKPSALKAEDWDRVVAVFVLGKEWQFKDWPFKDHVEIFNRIIGFFMRFEDDSVESAKIVKQWNVKIISISKNKRHQDRAAALEVWDRLEEFVRSRSHS